MTAPASHEPLGLIGLGLLGSALAERLLASGYQVVGYDIDRTKRTALEVLGGRIENSAEGVARHCDTLLLSLPTSAIVWEVMQQVTGQLAPHAIVMDTTTGDPSETQRTTAWLLDRSIGYLDATIAGSSEQVRQHMAVAMVGSTSPNFERAYPVLQAIAKQIFHVGPCGSGARMKLIVNLVLGLNRAVLAEGLALARHCGVDPRQALEVLKSGAAYSAVMDVKGDKMVDADFTPQARLGQHLKDVTLIRTLARDVSAYTPLSDLHEQLLRQVVELGFQDDDNSAIIKAFLPPTDETSTTPGR